MSHEGKMARGLKWYNCRNQDGVLPTDITEDPGKMCDVTYFLELSKPVKKEEPKVKEKK